VAIVRAFDFEPSQTPVTVLSVPPLHYHRPRRPAGRWVGGPCHMPGATLPSSSLAGQVAALAAHSHAMHYLPPGSWPSPSGRHHRSGRYAPGKTQAAACAKAGGSTTGTLQLQGDRSCMVHEGSGAALGRAIGDSGQERELDVTPWRKP